MSLFGLLKIVHGKEVEYYKYCKYRNENNDLYWNNLVNDDIMEKFCANDGRLDMYIFSKATLNVITNVLSY